MEEWRITAKRITKYSPQFRGDKGEYLKDDWTSYSDIGKVFEGVILTQDHYERVEQRYIDFVEKVIGGIILSKEITLTEIYFHSEIADLVRNNDQDLIPIWELIHSGRDSAKYTSLQLREIMQMVLREYIDFEIHVNDRNYHCVVRFGDDFYMYINSNIEDFLLKEISDGLSLFFES